MLNIVFLLLLWKDSFSYEIMASHKICLCVDTSGGKEAEGV